jgi:hypothetical protein
LLNGYESNTNGAANTISRVGTDGMIAAKLFGMASSSVQFWYATTWGGTTIFRATDIGVYSQAITSPRAVQVNSNGTLGTVASTRRAKENITATTCDVAIAWPARRDWHVSGNDSPAHCLWSQRIHLVSRGKQQRRRYALLPKNARLDPWLAQAVCGA